MPRNKSIILRLAESPHPGPRFGQWPEIEENYIKPALDKVFSGIGLASDIMPAVTRAINKKYCKKREEEVNQNGDEAVQP